MTDFDIDAHPTATAKTESPFGHYLQKMVTIRVMGHSREIFGKLIVISEPFLVIEFQDGRRTLVRTRAVSLIVETRGRC